MVRDAGYAERMGASALRHQARLAVTVVAAVIALGAGPAAGAGTSTTPTGTPLPTTSTRCTRKVARALIPQTPVGAHFLKVIGGDPWSIVQLGCLKLMGGNQRDMVALASCCTAASPTPLFIFHPTSSGWVLSYSRGKPLISEIARLGHALIEKRPVYHRSTPLCCPDGYTYWSLGYHRYRWVITRTVAPAPS
jgi:hypothetical protein